MRKFLCEYEDIYTMDDLVNFFENEADDRDCYDSFSAWLSACMYWNNGSLTEILTEDTPHECESRSVVFCRVLRDLDWKSRTEENDYFGFTEDDYISEEWLHVSAIDDYRKFGFSVSVVNV